MIVINNNSTDETIKIINSFNDHRISTYNINNHGVIARSRNTGIKCSNGSYIAFLDSDDWWYPNKLEVVMDKKQNADFIYHYLNIYKGERKTRNKHRIRQLNKPVFSDLMLKANAIANSSVVVKKDILLSVNCLNEDSSIKGVEDYDLWLRIARKTDSFLLIPDYLGGYLISGKNTSNISNELINKIDLVYKKNAVHLNYKDKKEAFNTKEYTKGRYFFLLSQYNEALECLNNSITSKFIEFKIKSFFLIIIIKFSKLIYRIKL